MLLIEVQQQLLAKVVLLLLSCIFSFTIITLLITTITTTTTTTTTALPLSQPYIAYRTDPYHHNDNNNNTASSVGVGSFIVHNNYDWDVKYHNERIQQAEIQHYAYLYNEKDTSQCSIPLLRIGKSHRIHSSSTAATSTTTTTTTRSNHAQTSVVSTQPPLIVPIPPFSFSSSSNSRSTNLLHRKQILYNTNYEHLDLYYSTGTTGTSKSSTTGSTLHDSRDDNDNDDDTSSDSSTFTDRTTTTTTTTDPKNDHRRRHSRRHDNNNNNKNNILVQDRYYPLLFESSIMIHLHPILYDLNYDGIYDIILSDYDGGITIISSGNNNNYDKSKHNQKAYHHTQVPRLYIRREWMEHFVLNSNKNDTETTTNTMVDNNDNNKNDTESITTTGRKDNSKNIPHDPFHSYFEFYYSNNNNNNNNNNIMAEDIIRGHTANILHQDVNIHDTIQNHYRQQQQSLAQNKRRLLEHQLAPTTTTTTTKATTTTKTTLLSSSHDENNESRQQYYQNQQHRRLQEVVEEVVDNNNEEDDTEHNNLDHDDDIGIPELDLFMQEQEQNQNLNHREADLYKNGNQQDYGDDKIQHQLYHPPDYIPDEQDPRNQHQAGGDGSGTLYDDPILADIRLKQNEIMQHDESSSEKEDNIDGANTIYDVDQMPKGVGDDMAANNDIYDGEAMMDDYAMYARHGDDMYPGGNGDYAYNDYYDSKHYIRLPPHILTTPTLMEVPKIYSNDKYEKEDMLFVAVSYYFDEDEYDGLLSSYQRFQNTDLGDETEARRGSYVANAIMVYMIGSDGSTSQRWIGQTHLDLSSDYTAPENITVVGQIPIHADVTQMSALALASPTIVDLDGDGKMEVIIGTNMGMLYVFSAQQMILQREYWPIQFVHPIEHPILVEDVIGNTSLEMFVSDIGGTLACLNHRAEVLWQHNLVLYLPLNAELNIDPTATSPMTLGDVNGDGFLDVVQIIRTQQRSYIFAVTASTGKTLPNYPIELDGILSVDEESEEVHYKLTQPLLVDLHTDQSFISEYLHRQRGLTFTRRQRETASSSSTSKVFSNKDAATTTKTIPNGGIGPGLHIVIPHGDAFFIVEGSTGCTQKLEFGTEISSMVQVDDIHGTGQLDLVVVTTDGIVVTLDTSIPYHPLNTWTGGSKRNHRSTSHAHGYSASQGIFVHDITRQHTNIFGVYVPITFEIFDNRPNIMNEPEQRKYLVEVRDGPSWKRALWRNTYNATGIYTDRVFIRYGPGYYTLYVTMQTSHGIIYEDTFSIGYNIHFLDGLDIYLWLPLLIAAIVIFLFGASRQPNWNSIHEIDNYDDENNNNGFEYYDNGREGHSLGILGRAQLPT